MMTEEEAAAYPFSPVYYPRFSGTADDFEPWVYEPRKLFYDDEGKVYPPWPACDCREPDSKPR